MTDTPAHAALLSETLASLLAETFTPYMRAAARVSPEVAAQRHIVARLVRAVQVVMDIVPQTQKPGQRVLSEIQEAAEAAFTAIKVWGWLCTLRCQRLIN